MNLKNDHDNDDNDNDSDNHDDDDGNRARGKNLREELDDMMAIMLGEVEP